jgi:hypothetical protein
MTIARLDEVATWDDEGNIEGLQFGGRDRSIQEWRDKQEELEYQRLFATLAARNKLKKLRETDPEGYAKQKEVWNRWNRTHAMQRAAAARAKREAAYKADPPICSCEECGAQWCPVFFRTGPKISRFCSKECRAKPASRRYAVKLNRGLHRMGVSDLIVDYVSQHPGCNPGSVAQALLHHPATVRSHMHVLVNAGRLERIGRGRYRAIKRA